MRFLLIIITNNVISVKIVSYFLFGKYLTTQLFEVFTAEFLSGLHLRVFPILGHQSMLHLHSWPWFISPVRVPGKADELCRQINILPILDIWRILFIFFSYLSKFARNARVVNIFKDSDDRTDATNPKEFKMCQKQRKISNFFFFPKVDRFRRLKLRFYCELPHTCLSALFLGSIWPSTK